MSTGRTARATDMAGAIPDFSKQFEVYGLLFRATGQGDQAPESLNNALVANPLNMQARYTIVKDYLAELSRGEGPEDIQEAAAQLSGPAARLRAAWRVNATEDRERLAREALQFINRALILYTDEDFHHQVLQPATTTCTGIASVTALRAMTGTHKKTGGPIARTAGCSFELSVRG